MTHTLAKDEPLWPDERIVALAKQVGNPWVAAAMRSAMLQVRAEYEAERTQMQARISELEAQAIADGWNIADTDRRYHEAMEENEHLEQQLAQAQARAKKPMRVITQPDFVIDLEDDE